MIPTTNRTRTSFRLMLIMFCLAFSLAWPPMPSQAGPELPPREPLPIQAHDARDDEKGGSKSAGAYIELSVSAAPAGAWTIVQWQDNAGNWYNVEGWQGSLEGNGKHWWVAASDFGKGPFRWVVTSGPGGPSLGTSEPFYLPGRANETVWIRVSVGS